MNAPEGYKEVYHLSITDQEKMTRLSVLSIALIVPFYVLMMVWSDLVISLRGTFTANVVLPGLILVLLVLPFHELVHGLVIQRYGYHPRYGMKYVDFGPVKVPYVLFATADGVFFTRAQFIAIALAPAIVITLLGMLFTLLLPDAYTSYITLAVVINGSGAIGDFWMTAVVLRYTPQALVLDEADSIRVYLPAATA